jgi:transposase
MTAPLPKKMRRKLQRLLEQRNQLETAWRQANDELGLTALKIAEKGYSRTSVARALGVGTSTVQGWVNRGRQVSSDKRATAWVRPDSP